MSTRRNSTRIAVRRKDMKEPKINKANRAYEIYQIIKNKDTEAFLQVDEYLADGRELYACELAEISIHVAIYGNVQMFNHMFKLLESKNGMSSLRFLGRFVRYADKFNNDEMLKEVIKYINENDLKEKILANCERGYHFNNDDDRDVESSKVFVRYFDCTDLLDKYWLQGETREIIEKQKLYKTLQKNLSVKGKSPRSKI